MAAIVYALPDLGQYCRPGLLFLASWALFIIYRTLLVERDPNTLPYFDRPPGKTGFNLRTYYRYYTDCGGLMREAYEKFLSKGKPVFIPGLGSRKELILPNTSMKWALAQPPHILNQRAGVLEQDCPKYLLGDDSFLTDPWQGLLIKAELQPSLDHVCAVMNIELEAAFSDYFGNDTDAWREIDLLSTVRKIIGRASSRFTVGEPLCRNEEYIRATFDTVDQTHLETGITLLTPTLLQPIIGQFVGRRANARFAKLAQMIKSEYERRLAMLQYPRGDPQIKDQEPSDYFQIMLRFAQRERPQDLASLETMTRRLFLANFGSMHRTSFQTANMLLNIIDSDAKYNTVDMLREEISRVLTQAGAEANDMASWNRAKLGQLLRADSVARETMRLNSFDNRGCVRKVLADGVTTEDGLPLPRGTVLSFLGHPAQVDEDVYADAQEYDPFRFSRPHEAAMAPAGKAEGEEGKVAPSAPGLGAQSFVTTSPYHLPFGHGRTACPGRFLVDLELKMIVAYAVTRYDLEFPAVYGGKRPRPVWLCESMVPPKGAKIRVKRRKV